MVEATKNIREFWDTQKRRIFVGKWAKIFLFIFKVIKRDIFYFHLRISKFILRVLAASSNFSNENCVFKSQITLFGLFM